MFRKSVVISSLAIFLLGCPDVEQYTAESVGGVSEGQSSAVTSPMDVNTPADMPNTGGVALPLGGALMAGYLGQGGEIEQGGDQGMGGDATGVGGSSIEGGDSHASGGEADAPLGGAPGGTDVDQGNAGGVSTQMEEGGPADIPSSCIQVFSVTLPDNTPSSDTIYIAGTFYGEEAGGQEAGGQEAGGPQNWEPAEKAMTRNGNTATFELEVHNTQRLSYKYTRGTWPQVEVLANCSEKPNRNLLVRCPTAERVDTIPAWQDLAPCQ